MLLFKVFFFNWFSDSRTIIAYTKYSDHWNHATFTQFTQIIEITQHLYNLFRISMLLNISTNYSDWTEITQRLYALKFSHLFWWKTFMFFMDFDWRICGWHYLRFSTVYSSHCPTSWFDLIRDTRKNAI